MTKIILSTSIYPSILFYYLSIHLSIYTSIHLPTYLPVYLPFPENLKVDYLYLPNCVSRRTPSVVTVFIKSVLSCNRGFTYIPLTNPPLLHKRTCLS